jgi:solute carrier family 25 carnitine/acylcarnitine transporter 20/29
MFHQGKNTSWEKEAFFTLITGFLYGSTSVVVGHPTDTIKTKMQAQEGHFQSKKGWLEISRDIYRSEGPKGFYRGALAPFFGSTLYRST